MLAVDINKLNDMGYSYKLLDDQVVLIYNFIKNEEIEYLLNFAKGLQEEGWHGEYIKSLEDRAELQHGDRNLENKGIEITRNWDDKVCHLRHTPEIYDAAKKISERLEDMFVPQHKKQFQGFGIIQRMYEGTELKAHFDRYSDKDLVHACIGYLNDDYNDGELYFEEKGISLKPPTGSVIVFPATEEYIHGVKFVGAGPVRYVLPGFMSGKKA